MEAITNEQVAATDKTAKPSRTGKSKKELAVAASKEQAKRSSLTLMTGKKINLNAKKVADLLPELAMLKGLYAEGKERISQLNAKETQSKQRFEAQQRQHSARLATIEARFKKTDFHTNETKDENRNFTYWEKVRAHQHRQFYTSLKIQRGTMEKEKIMIDAYEQTIAGTDDRAQIQKEIANVSGEQDVVFVQVALRSAAKYFSDALFEVRAAKEKMRKLPPMV